MENLAVPHDVTVADGHVIIRDTFCFSHDSYGESVNFHVLDPIWMPSH